MTTALLRRASARHLRPWLAVIAIATLIAAPLLAVSPAHAAPVTGYTGEVQDGGQDWPDKHLSTMTVGTYYEDSLEAPFYWDDRDHGVPFAHTGLPQGLSFGLGGRVLTLTGTPESTESLNLTISWYGTEGAVSVLKFTDGEVEAGKLPTTTTLSVPEVLPYDAMAVTASVTADGVPTGGVEFWADSVNFATDTLDEAGVAADTKAIDISNVGSSVDLTAKYLGDTAYDTSESSATPVLIYAPVAHGVLYENGQVVIGAVVEMFSVDDPGTAIAWGTTDSDGSFELSPGAISSTADAQKQYYIRGIYPDDAVLYYHATDSNVLDSGSASTVGPLTWKSELAILRGVPPVWTDSTLATPRDGSEYEDGVSAASPNPVAYSVSSGVLPIGLSLNATTGAVTGTPACGDDSPFPFFVMETSALDPCAYDVTITADNGYGTVFQQFSGTLLPAGVAPTWSDQTLADFQVATPVDDRVAAVGDPTIAYSVTAGELPDGLSLAADTGALSGTPTTPGPFDFTITASNEFGSVTADFEGEVTAAPEIGLTLRFDAGTALSDASSAISADGLKVGSEYTLTMYSTPVVLYQGIIGPTGGFTWNVALPADTPVGSHRLVLTGIAPDGSTMTAEAWFTLLANGTIGAISYTGPLSLPVTGADPAALVAASSLLLASGILLTLLGTRRRVRA